MPYRIKALLIDNNAQEHPLTNNNQQSQYNDNFLVIDHVHDIHHGLEAMLSNRYDVYLLESSLIALSDIDLLSHLLQDNLTNPFIIIMGEIDNQSDLSYQIQQLERVYHLNHTNLASENIFYEILNVLEAPHTPMSTHYDELLRKRDRYIKQLMLLNQVDEEINLRFNLRHVLDIAMDASLRLGNAQTGFIALLQGEQLRIQKYIGQSYKFPADRVINEPWIQEAFIQNEGLLLSLEESTHITPFFEDSQAIMVLPLQSRSQDPIGVILLEATDVGYFTLENFDFMKRLSKRLAVALEHSQLYRELEGRYAELEQLYHKISRLEQIKTDMIRIAAHDIRTPVNAIMNCVEILQRGNINSEKAAEIVSWIGDAAQDADNITKNILSLEQIENLQHEVLVPTDLCHTTLLSYNRFAQQAVDAKVKMEINIPKAPVFVAGQEYLLQEAIANFISNAIKYTPEQGHIQINLYIENGNAVFSVIDNGCGIPNEQQAALFQPFYRVQNNVTQNVGGTGLGLYLIKRIVESFNGEVFFTSKFGEGSTFGLKLPIYFR